MSYLYSACILACYLYSGNTIATEDQSTLPGLEPQAIKQACIPGHTFASNIVFGIGYDSNTRPPSETIQPGAGNSSGSGNSPASQSLVEVSQSDTVINASASLKHGYCLTTQEDDLAIIWVSRAAVSGNRYFNLEGANENSINLSTGPALSSNWVWQVAPALDFETATLESDPYRQRLGISSNQLWNISRNWQAGFRVSIGQLEFDQVPDTIHVEGDDKSLYVESSAILSPKYKIKVAANHTAQSTDDPKLSYDQNAYQLTLSRWHSLHCDAYLRYQSETSDYESLALSGSARTDEISEIELGGCAAINPAWTVAASIQRITSDSNVIEFEYKKTQLEISMRYKF